MRSLNSGKYTIASRQFLRASNHATDSFAMASAFQMRGVALRLNTEYLAAHNAFLTAMMYALGNEVLRLVIMRDMAMSFMIQKNFRIAAKLLIDSCKGLEMLDEKIEAAVSKSFLGRVEFQVGRLNIARQLLTEVDEILTDGPNRDCEMNNLIWLIKTVEPSDRTHLLIRAVRLVRTTRQWRKLVEFTPLLSGGDRLYDIVDSHYRCRSGT